MYRTWSLKDRLRCVALLPLWHIWMSRVSFFISDCVNLHSLLKVCKCCHYSSSTLDSSLLQYYNTAQLRVISATTLAPQLLYKGTKPLLNSLAYSQNARTYEWRPRFKKHAEFPFNEQHGIICERWSPMKTFEIAFNPMMATTRYEPQTQTEKPFGGF